MIFPVALSIIASGQSFSVDSLEPGDVIVSTAKNNVVSSIIRAQTKSDVSHAMIYVGGGDIVEAVGDGVVRRKLTAALSESTLAIAFRVERLKKGKRAEAAMWASIQTKRDYAYGKVLSHPRFGLRRPGCGGDACTQTLTDIEGQMPTEFFCSELVFWALARADSVSTPAQLKPEATAPGDVHMRALLEDLVYLGHLKGSSP